MQNFLLYGANGYTAQLIIDLAQQYGLRPILAGRNEAKIKALAEKHQLDYRVFSLDNPEEIDAALNEVDVVAHCAGPFMYTAKPMIKACMRTKTHYLDITGEIEVFELANHYGPKAKEAGIMLMPGTGFDVVPTDCMARYLYEKMPDATNLELAIASIGGGVSHGTASTVVENLGKSGAARIDGRIKKVKSAHKTRYIPFGEKKLFGATIPWGDVSTAYHNTGIPNIVVYMCLPKKQVKMMRLQDTFGFILKRRWVKNMLIKRIKKNEAGPNQDRRTKAKSLVWGEVTNAKGEKKSAWLNMMEGYTLTAHTCLMICKKVLDGNAPIGFQTPAKAYGHKLIMELEGSELKDL